MMRMMEAYEFTPAPPAAQMFGNAGRDHMKKYGTKPETFAKIAYKVLYFLKFYFMFLSFNQGEEHFNSIRTTTNITTKCN